MPAGTILIWLKKRDSQFATVLSDAELGWVKGGKGIYCWRHVWSGCDRASERGKTLHPTQKPVALMRWIIERMRIPRGTTIVDPYCGSGATLLAAAELGYEALGIELSPAYFAVARKRLEKFYESHSRLPGTV